jgi:hypothetical protein
MFKPSEEMLKLKAFFINVPNGAYLTYKNIEKQTEIKMDSRGRQLMRSALHSLKREYNCDIGKGIEIEASHNCMSIVTGRVRKVSGTLKRADKTASRMAGRYLDDMPPEDRNRLLATASLFGAIKAMAKGLTDIYGQKPKSLNTINQQNIPKHW